jgi:RIO-like serine/threonine protein kinase
MLPDNIKTIECLIDPDFPRGSFGIYFKHTDGKGIKILLATRRTTSQFFLNDILSITSEFYEQRKAYNCLGSKVPEPFEIVVVKSGSIYHLGFSMEHIDGIRLNMSDMLSSKKIEIEREVKAKTAALGLDKWDYGSNNIIIKPNGDWVAIDWAPAFPLTLAQFEERYEVSIAA